MEIDYMLISAISLVTSVLCIAVSVTTTRLRNQTAKREIGVTQEEAADNS